MEILLLAVMPVDAGRTSSKNHVKKLHAFLDMQRQQRTN